MNQEREQHLLNLLAAANKRIEELERVLRTEAKA